MRTGIAAIVLALVVAACGNGTEPATPASGGAPAAPSATPTGSGATPRATFEAFRAAAVAKDTGAFYDLMGPAVKGPIVEQFEQSRDLAEGKAVEGMPEMSAEDRAAMLAEMKEQLGYDPAELKSMTARDFFMRMMAKSIGEISKDAEKSVFVSEKIDGDKAVVTARTGDETETLNMVLVDGKWYIADME